MLRRRLIKNQITQKIRFVPRAFTTGQEFRSGHRAFKWGRGGDYIFFELVDKIKLQIKVDTFLFLRENNRIRQNMYAMACSK